MRVAIIASHAWPIPSQARTGDSFILYDLSHSLAELGHEVDLYAPPGTTPPEGVTLRPMPLEASRFEGKPNAAEAEGATLERYSAELKQADVIHDCGVGKLIHAAFPDKALCTIWGGPWRHKHEGRNVVAQSHAQRERLLRGATDYENTPTPAAGGPNGTPLKDCRVVWNGTDTDVHRPSGKAKQDWFLMLSRWHPVRGVEQGIELAKATGINLLIAGTDPDEDHPVQAAYARKMCELIRGHDNISIEFLPLGTGPEHTERKVELYSDALALLFLPQFAEPFGLPQIESLACGTFVVADERGSTREVLECCFDLTRDDQSWLTKEQGWNGLGRESRKRALEHFDRRVMARKYLELYAEVAGGGGWG